MRTERVILLFFILAIGLKLLHIPGTAAFLTALLFGLSAMYLLFGFYFFSIGSIRNQNLIISIIAGILLSIAPIGILFRLQYWPGSRALALSGTMFALVILLVMLLLMLTSDNDKLRGYYRNMIIRSSLLFIVTGMLFFAPRSTRVRIEYWNDPKMAELKLKYLDNADDPKARQAYLDYMKEKGY